MSHEKDLVKMKTLFTSASKGTQRKGTQRKALLSLLVAAGLGGTSLASAQDLLPRDNGIFTYHTPPRYRESEAHPLRVFGYVLHPFGWVLREGVTRPLSAMASSTEFTRSFFGYREPFDFREPVCFSNIDVPDCRRLPPMMGIGMAAASDSADAMASSERQVYIPDVNFEFNKSTLNDLGRGRIRQISQLLASVPSLKVVVEGHTDYKGSDQFNQNLGDRRAQAVLKELTDLGIDSARMSPMSYGESKPVFTEEEDWARAVNRRVQFTVQGAAMQADSMPAAAERKS